MGSLKAIDSTLLEGPPWRCSRTDGMPCPTPKSNSLFSISAIHTAPFPTLIVSASSLLFARIPLRSVREVVKWWLHAFTGLSGRVTILVVFCGPQLVKVSVMRTIVAQIVNKESLNELILILQNKITKLRNVLMSCHLKLRYLRKTTADTTDLLVNITKHVLKPKHQVLTDREKH
ncbi:LOW QUALITY PROTEIN: hypothetical protein Cgig2_001448 [Carnegiea gigantea]|uniref:Uncharacterized protein n=1 Tax=Carnegiea gigantea TaxID=171969 RepID=A0A9Q1KWC6_9CARY|nr:LOW QUALITY PROTEIN: hypothetical protein Cgig2_001448 [Carnegiea gigantea]